MLGFIGGTGPEGQGLALRLAAAGEEVLLGSRDPERARRAAEELRGRAPGVRVEGDLNREVARRAEVVFLCVPYGGHADTVRALADALAGKVVVDVVAPLAFEKGWAHALPVPEGSAAEQAQALAPGARLVAGFHHLSAHDLLDLDHPLEADVLLCGDDAEAKGRVMELAGRIPGLRPVDAGPLRMARYLEPFTAVLLNVNRRYRVRASLRLTGL